MIAEPIELIEKIQHAAAGVARMKCNGIRGNPFDRTRFGHAHQTPDFTALHPGYVSTLLSAP